MIYIFLEIFLILILTIFFKRKLEQSIFLILTSLILFILISTLLPDGFNDDQYVFLDTINNRHELPLKAFFHGLFNPNFFYNSKIVIEFAQFSLGLANLYAIYLLFNYSGLHNLKMWIFLILCSGYTIHVFSFLREPFLYFFITIFVFLLREKKIIFSMIFLFLIGLCRIDSLIYILPFSFSVLMIHLNKKNIIIYLVIGYLITYYLLFFGPFKLYVQSYILMFYEGTQFSIFGKLFNLFIPTTSFVKILFQTQILAGLYYIYKIKNNNIKYFRILITILFFTLIFFLTISNNFGWLLRISSGYLLLIYLIYLDTVMKNLKK